MRRILNATATRFARLLSSSVARDLLGALAALAAALLRWSLVGQLGDVSPYLFVHPAVLFVAFFLGLRPGLAAALTGVVLTEFQMASRRAGSTFLWLELERGAVVLLGAGLMGLLSGAIRQRRKTLEEILAGIPGGFLAVDNAWRITVVNAAAEREYGRFGSAGVQVGQGYWETFAAFRGTELESRAHEVMQTRRSAALEIQLPDSRIWHKVYLSPFGNGVSFHWYDISELKGAHEATRRVAEQHRLALEAGRLGWWELDLSSETVSCDDRYGEIHGLAGQRLGLASVAGSVHPEDQHRVRAFLSTVMHGSPGPFQIPEYRVLRADGSVRWTVGRGEALSDAASGGGKVSRLIGAVEDVTDRKRAEQLRQESEERYRNLVDMSPDGIFICRGERIVLVNPAALRLFGLTSSSEAIGRSPCEFISPDDHPVIRRHLEEALAGLVAAPRQVKMVEVDGSTKVVEIVATSHPVSGGPAAQVVIRDISERKRLEEEVTRLAGFPLLNPNPVIEADADGNVRFANPAAQTLFPDLVARGRLHPYLGDWEQVTAMFGPAAASFLHREVTVDDRWYHQTISRVPESRRVNVYGLEITDQKKAEKALRDSERLYRGIGESIDYGVWVCAPDGRNIYASESFLKLVGLTQEQCSDFGWGDVLHPEDSERTIAAWKECVRTGGKWDIEHRFRGTDGAWHAVLARGVPVKDDSGQVICWAGINLDIDAAKQAQEALRAGEEALRRANEQLEEKVRARTAELAGLVSRLQDEVSYRELAETMLKTAYEQLSARADQLRELAAELTRTEQRERLRLARLIHDQLQQLLVAAKFRVIGLARTDVHPAHDSFAGVEQLIDEAIGVSRSLTSELSPPIMRGGGLAAGLEWLVRWMKDRHGLDVNLDVPESLPPFTDEIKLLIFESVRELLFNVVKHAGVSSAVATVRPEDGHSLHICVSDCGRGFDTSMNRPLGGDNRGFGLFSINERVNLLGGTLHVESTSGKGSRLTLTVPTSPAIPTLPLARTFGELLAEVKLRPSVATEAKIRVLLVDDHAVFREGLVRLLEYEADIEVAGQATDGLEAVVMAATLQPDVILMDVSMPGLSGLEATREILNRLPETTVVGLSMYEEAEQAEAMRRAGAAEYLSKSGPSAALIEAIRRCGRGRGRGPAHLSSPIPGA
jgi:PAS domain S-box-containing protein